MDNQNNNGLNQNPSVSNAVPSQLNPQNAVQVNQQPQVAQPQVNQNVNATPVNSGSVANNQNAQNISAQVVPEQPQVQSSQIVQNVNPNNISSAPIINTTQNVQNNVTDLKGVDDNKFVSAPQQQQLDTQVSVAPNPTLPIDNLMNNQSAPQSFIKPVEQVQKSSDDLLNAVPKPDMMISSPAESRISTDDLLEDFIQKNYEKISNKKINFAAFFFSSFYMLYRKMFISGIIVYFIEMAIMYFALLYNPALITLSFGINFIVSIILLFAFNKIYINNSKSKIDKIKNKNKVISVSELRKLCAKKGGTSLGTAIITSIIISLVFTVSFNSLFPIDADELKNKLFNTINTNTSDNNSNSDNTSNNDTNKENKELDLSNLNYVDNVSLSDKLTMQYLAIFNPTDNNSDSKYDYIKLTDEANELSYCKFNLGIIKDYNDSKKLLNDLAKYYKVNDIEDINAKSGLTWKNFVREGNSEKIYYAAINNNDETYLFEYTISSEASDSLCRAYYNAIINSIQFN